MFAFKQGDYQKKTSYSNDPVAVAKQYESLGFVHVHVVDLDGAKARKVINLDTLEAICKQTKLKIDFGGGINSREDLEKVFAAGVNQVNLGTIAIKNQGLVMEWMDEFGVDKFILSTDVKKEKVAIAGWEKTSSIDWRDFLLSYTLLGIPTCVCTDITKDGMLEGPSVELYRQIKEAFPELRLVASGGVRNLKDLKTLQAIGCRGAIVGKSNL